MDRGGASKGASAAWVSPLQGWGITAIRVIVGIVFVAHGGQKLLESGFSGFAGNLQTISKGIDDADDDTIAGCRRS